MFKLKVPFLQHTVGMVTTLFPNFVFTLKSQWLFLQDKNFAHKFWVSASLPRWPVLRCLGGGGRQAAAFLG